jgi:two-component system response regulator AtoC
MAAISADEPEPSSLKEIVKKQTQSLERDLIERALEDTLGNVTRAAEKLGLSRKGLQLKMKELHISRHLDADEKD